jgi:hypothetical protein
VKNILKYVTDDTPVEINLCKSAPNQIKPLPAIEELITHWKKRRHKEIIDVGCGKLRNSLALVRHFSLWICDFPEQLDNPTLSERLNRLKRHSNFKGIIYPNKLGKGRLNADAGVVSYVLHILPDEKSRRLLVKDTMKNIKPPFEIFVAVPYGERFYRKKFQTAQSLNDGFVLNSAHGYKTFYREYTAKEIDQFMERLGFKVDKIFRRGKQRLRCYLKAD